MSKSTLPKRRRKAAKSKAQKTRKSRPDFPLFKHQTGRWCKKVRGRFCYFGKIADDPEGKAALQLWLEQRDDLLAGREPRGRSTEGVSVRDLCNRFLTCKAELVDTSELTPRSFADYKRTCSRIIDAFGRHRLLTDLRPEDFQRLRAQLAKGRGPVALGNEIQRTRVCFKFAFDAALVDRPIRFGPHFKRPSKRILRLERQKNGPRMFEAPEIRQLLDVADPVMKAMVLLGINCGFGQTDIANLRKSHVDLKRGWIDFPRPKTGIKRRCPLWPETLAALEEAITGRPEPRDRKDVSLCFLTKTGLRWVRFGSRGGTIDSVAPAFNRLLRALGLYRPRVGFYALRHTVETIGGEHIDQVALNILMGHEDRSMAEAYRERISDERLRAVAECVRRWLYGGGDGTTHSQDA